ncbi:F-box/kelch-repeat protein like [Capsicum annuum]
MEDLNLTIPFLSAELTTEILSRLPVKSLLKFSSKSSILWNPTIRKYSYLPGFRRRWEKTYARYGFGYDEIHDDYKVVGIFHAGSDSGGDSDDVEVQIYSLKSDVWTNVDGSYRKKRLNGSCLFATGKLHWNTNTTTNDWIIVSFDLGNEKWEMIEKPSYGEGEWDS